MCARLPGPARIVRTGHLPSPVGTLTVGVTDAGLAALEWDDDAGRLEAGLRQRFACTFVAGGLDVDAALARIAAWFAGRIKDFGLDVDLAGLTPFQRRVLEALCDVPAGGWCTYGDLARRVGSPGAARAVGNAVGRNPVPIVVPCHRVLHGGGGIGGFGGGLDRKRTLLRIEGCTARGIGL